MFSEARHFSRNLHFLLLTETDGNGQLNISMQQLATSFDLILKIFINAPTTMTISLGCCTKTFINYITVTTSLLQLCYIHVTMCRQCLCQRYCLYATIVLCIHYCK